MPVRRLRQDKCRRAPQARTSDRRMACTLRAKSCCSSIDGRGSSNGAHDAGARWGDRSEIPASRSWVCAKRSAKIRVCIFVHFAFNGALELPSSKQLERPRRERAQKRAVDAVARLRNKWSSEACRSGSPTQQRTPPEDRDPRAASAPFSPLALHSLVLSVIHRRGARARDPRTLPTFLRRAHIRRLRQRTVPRAARRQSSMLGIGGRAPLRASATCTTATS